MFSAILMNSVNMVLQIDDMWTCVIYIMGNY